MWSHLSYAHLLTLHGLVTATAVLLYVVTSHVMQLRRPPAVAISWILFILLLPYAALPAYLLFGSRKLRRPHLQDWHGAGADTGDAWAIQTILALDQPAPAPYVDLNIHKDGSEALQGLLRTIDAAQESIDLCTFIIGSDSLGRTVVDSLCKKAASGVRVRVLLDGLGKLMVAPPDLERLVQSGGTYTVFAPPLRLPPKQRANLRDHRKLVVADAGRDSARMWCGGRNLATEYFEGEPGVAPWRDLSFDVRGPLVEQARALFERDWEVANGRRARHQHVEGPADMRSPSDGAQLVASGPDQADDTIYQLLVTAAYRARRRIALASPYFVPDTALLTALSLAARRGVAVDLLIPRKSNHRLSDLVRGRALRSLSQAGVRVWLAPAMLHAKLVVIDETLALSGSANLDSRSLFLNYELMVAFHRTADVQRFGAWFSQERLSAHPYVATAPSLVRDIADGMLLWLAFQL